MGAFFLTNDHDAIPSAIDWMRAKGFAEPTELRWGGMVLIAFPKLFVAGHTHVVRQGDDVLVGVGTYTYDGLFGVVALEAILAAVRRGERPFAHVGGHCAFVLWADGKVQVISDKTGIYHVYTAQEGASTYVSSSMLAVARSLPAPRVAKQECLEFLLTQGTYGGRTIFEQVTHLQPGSVFDASAAMSLLETYYTPVDTRAELDAYLRECTEYLSAYRAPELRFNCDLSGGYDSRTVAALLERSGVEISYNTNTNLTDPSDHQIAQELAHAVGREIRVFDRDYEKHGYGHLVERAFHELEISRDAFSAAYSPVVFEEKSRHFDVQFGGYGGELLRDKYSRFASIDALLDASYMPQGLRGMSSAAIAAYRDGLTAKFEETLRWLGETDTKKSMEKLYTYERMRYWGGSRITAYNQYCYRVHPLFDDRLARFSFSFTLEEKAKAALQRRIITAASPTLARVRSSYLDQPLVYDDDAATKGPLWHLDTKRRAAVARARRLYVQAMNVEQLSPLRRWLGRKTVQAQIPKFTDLYQPSGRVADAIGIELGSVFNRKMVGRYLTLEKALEAVA